MRKSKLGVIALVIFLLYNIINTIPIETVKGFLSTESLQTLYDKLLPETQNEAYIYSEFKQVTVERVVDGDTIVVLYEGKSEKVRLIGINTPESVHADESKNTKEGEEASKYTKGLIKKGQTVYLQKDVSDRDKYDRLLRYVWLEEPAEINEETVSSMMLNGILIKEGYAEPKEYYPDIKYSKVFKTITP